ncbi:hypothetical protein A2U01_0112161, partial [Trifolium medium]|nr:hypothetical protein [Trifolium medium]
MITPTNDDDEIGFKPEVEGQNVTDAEPVQNVNESELKGQDEPEVEVQNEPEVEGQVS